MGTAMGNMYQCKTFLRKIFLTRNSDSFKALTVTKEKSTRKLLANDISLLTAFYKIKNDTQTPKVPQYKCQNPKGLLCIVWDLWEGSLCWYTSCASHY